jgi:hypothetical protein
MRPRSGGFKIRRQIDRKVAGPPAYNRRFSGNSVGSRVGHAARDSKTRSAAFVHRSDKTARLSFVHERPRANGRGDGLGFADLESGMPEIARAMA